MPKLSVSINIKIFTSEKIINQLNQLSGHIPKLAIAGVFAEKCDVELRGIKGPDFYANGISVEVSKLTYSKNILRKFGENLLEKSPKSVDKERL